MYSSNLTVWVRVILIILFLSGIFFLVRFQSKIDAINKKQFDQHIEQVANISLDIESYIKNRYFPSVYKKLETDLKVQKELNNFLNQYSQYDRKDIFLLEPPQHNSIVFKVLGSGNKFDDYFFGESYEPLNESWNNILTQKKPLYFKNGIKGTWFTYHYPIINKGVLVAVITIDFSVENYHQIQSNIAELDILFSEYIYFMLFITVILAFLSLINAKIERNKLQLFKNLQKKNKQIDELNQNLENKVHLRTKELFESKLKMKEYINLVDQNIISSSSGLDGIIKEVSEAFCKISGYTKEELIGNKHSIIKHTDMPNEIYTQMWEKLDNNEIWKGEIKNRKKNGEFYWVEATIYPNFNEAGEKIGYTAIRQNITDHKIVEELSITDGLTNIFNRRHFNDILPKVINSAKRHNDLVSFLIIDIDHFKQYNDTYGHQMGDNALIKIATCIKETTKRADDYCFRLGGEEFGVIYKVDTKEKATEFANKIKENIKNLHIEHIGNKASLYVTASIGLICKNANDIKNEDEFYKQGDDLLYKAKKSGRNKVETN